MPYVAKLEKAGIPTVTVEYIDQGNLLRETFQRYGVPEARTVQASHTLAGPEDVNNFIEPMLEALTKPLTKKEKAKGVYNPPQPRILFEGTLDEAQGFYQQTRHIPEPFDVPISVYTDGFPIIVPTEERVKDMLTGTSHKPDELIPYAEDGPVGGTRRGERGEMRVQGEPVQFENMQWTANVEKVAVNAVMAGCRPEYLPVVLAIAQSGCPTGSQGNAGQWVCVSGPIVKELGMNSGVGLLNPGNPANATIGRTYQLMALNLGGAVTGVNRLSNHGNPFNTGGLCFAENADGLPPGWLGLNEEFGFRKDESIVMVMTGGNVLRGANTPPGGFRALQKSGHGGVARRLGVKGIPGPHNWLQYMVPDIWSDHDGGYTFLMIPEMANDLYKCGFTSKEQVYDWLAEKSALPLKEYTNRGGGDLSTNGWLGIEPTSGKHWRELPDDYMVRLIRDPFSNCIITCGGSTEFVTLLSGRPGGLSTLNVFSIDAWR